LNRSRSISNKIKELLSNTWWVLWMMWSINAPLTLAIMATTFMRSFFPAGLVLVTRSLVNTVVQLLGDGSKEMNTAIPWLILSFGLTLVHSVSIIANEYFASRLNDEVNLKIASDIMTHASGLDIVFFETPHFQDIMERVQRQTAHRLFQFVLSTLAVLTNSMQFISLFGILIVIEPLLVAAIFPLVIPYLIFHVRLARTRYQIEHHRATKVRWTLYFVTLLTDYQRVPEVKIFNLASYFIKKFRSLMTEFRDQDRKLYKRNFMGGSTFIAVSTLTFYITFARVIFRALRGTLTVGDVVVYGGAASTLRNLLNITVKELSAMYEHTLHIRNFREFLSISPGVDYHQGVKPPRVRGEIELRNVSFTYPGAEQRAVIDISLSINSGEIVALVGENAAGKTTLAKLIAGLYSPDAGSILIDGIDLREWSLAYFHSKLSFVFQDFGRYEATVADNIAYGDWQRLLGDRKEIERIARITNVHPIIEAMPQGYDTNLGRSFSTYNPSGGQWQNIAIARAFARDAAVLILDEPTSNLDARTEYDLFLRFREMAKGRTTILISHRFSTVSMADRIITLDEGRIVETGTHQALLSKGGLYASLYHLHQRQMEMNHGE
jgi:ATP-binding cassette subfamily B protein